MKLLKHSTFVLMILVASISLNAQTFDFKKGEIFDFLLLTNKPEADKHFGKYKETAFPVAMAMSYQPLPSYYGITDYTQGNQQPEGFVFGKWENLEKREKFIAEIDKKVLDFHHQRQKIWSYFGLTYYEMTNDVSFTINTKKHNVVTAYWKKDNASFNQFKKQWLKKSHKAGGKIIIELTNGKSPFGYYYNPDYLVITQWESKAIFDAFYRENLKMNHKSVKHVNQFTF